ncbi:unnamed protein product, partial [Mesorhabditis spiculigera]
MMQLPNPIAGGVLGAKKNLYTNLFHVEMAPEGRTLYKYNVEVYVSFRVDLEDPAGTRIDLTRSTSGPLATLNKQYCGRILRHVFTKTNMIGCRSLFYDHHQTLYVPVDLEQTLGCLYGIFQLEDDANMPPQKNTMVRFTLMDKFEFSEEGLVGLDGTTEERRRAEESFRDYIEVAVMRVCLEDSLEEDSEFLCFKGRKVYLRQPLHRNDVIASNSQQLLTGAKKAVEFYRGAERQMRIGMTIDVEKQCFLIPQPVIQSAMALCQRIKSSTWSHEDVPRLNRIFKGAHAYASYGTSHRRVTIGEIIFGTAQSVKFTPKEGGETMTIEKYFYEKYNITLQYPMAPLAECKRKDVVLHFPLECLIITAGNSVHLGDQPQEISSIIVKGSALLPMDRQRTIMEMIRREKIGIDLLDDAGFRIATAEPLKTIARQLPAPAFGYRNLANPVRGITNRGSWRRPNGFEFAKSAQVPMPIYIQLATDQNSRLDLARLSSILQQAAEKTGLQIAPNGRVERTTPDQLEQAFRTMQQYGYKFAVFISDDSLKYQDEIKYFERKYQVLTQNIRLKTAREILEAGKAATVENILQKMNTKLGGTCVELSRAPSQSPFLSEFEKGNIFVLGVGAPTYLTKEESMSIGAIKEKSVLTVLPYAANFGYDVTGFVGDFALDFCPPKQAVLRGAELLGYSLDSLVRTTRRPPPHIVIYRTGLVDSCIQKLMAQEITDIRALLKERVGQYRLTYLLMHKEHSTRFFKSQTNPNDNATGQNVEPGTVIDGDLMHPHRRQFFLNSHVALQGTAKTPRYTVVADDASLTMDDLEMMTYDLCYLHQIVNLPVQTPVPLYVAKEYGQRGKRILLQYLKDLENNAHNFSLTDAKHALEYRFADQLRNYRANA